MERLKMHKERDPRIVAVAEKLALAYPYGFEYVKSGPSAADYHAALIAVQTLDEMGDWEYAIEETKIGVGSVIMGGRWSPYFDNCVMTKERLERWHRDHYVATTGREWYSYKVVKRRKPQPYVEVDDD
jgi:hypothetical protein